MSRRTFIKTASGVVAVSVLGLPEVVRAQGSTAAPLAASPPGVATQRIDGLAKVTGRKVFARDFSARDMAGWPRTEWQALYLYALTTEHRFMTRRLSGKKSARGAALNTSQNLLRVEHHGLRVRQMAVIESWT